MSDDRDFILQVIDVGAFHNFYETCEALCPLDESTSIPVMIRDGHYCSAVVAKYKRLLARPDCDALPTLRDWVLTNIP